MRTSELLASAEPFIDTPEKWTKGQLFIQAPGGEITKCCLLGACHLALVKHAKERLDENNIFAVQFDLMTNCLGETIPTIITDKYHRDFLKTQVGAFNDDPETTYEDVINLLRAAIRRQRAIEGFAAEEVTDLKAASHLKKKKKS